MSYKAPLMSQLFQKVLAFELNVILKIQMCEHINTHFLTFCEGIWIVPNACNCKRKNSPIYKKYAILRGLLNFYNFQFTIFHI